MTQLKKFEYPDNKNIGKLFSKYELFFLDHANFSSDPFQILILQYPVPRAALFPSTSLSNFTLANWNPSSTQPSACSIESYPMQTHVTIIGYNKPNAKPSQSNLWYSYIQIIIFCQ